jgi:hypothetical protein
MTFAQIEALAGVLPRSERIYRECWAKDRTHVQAQAWLSSDRAIGAVDIARETVRFD